MASKINSFYSHLLIILLALCSSIYSFGNYGYPDYYDRCWDIYLESPNVTLLGFDKIEKSLIDSGRKIMTDLLRKNLHTMKPYCDEFVFFVDRHNKLTLYGNKTTVTLFVPRDDAMRIEEWISLESQFVMSKVDKRSFETGLLKQGSELVDIHNSDQPRWNPQVTDVSENGSSVTISGAKITHWDIYNDGHVIVHGTDDFFNHHKGGGTSGFFNEVFGWLDTDEFEVA